MPGFLFSGSGGGSMRTLGSTRHCKAMPKHETSRSEASPKGDQIAISDLLIIPPSPPDSLVSLVSLSNQGTISLFTGEIPPV